MPSLFRTDLLNRWQRTRLVILASSCGANLCSDTSSKEQQPPACCDCCGSEEALQKGTHALPLSAPARSLVDKHYDSLAQTMTELGIDTFSVYAGNNGDLVLALPWPSAQQQQQQQEGATTCCLLCSLARACNEKQKQQNAWNSDNAAEASSSTSPPAAARPWWWADSFDPNYINMETGDMGGADPLDELLLRPLSMWAENLRFVLAAAAARVAGQEEQARQRRDADAEEQQEAASPTVDVEKLKQVASAVGDQSSMTIYTLDNAGSAAETGNTPLLSIATERQAVPAGTAGFNRSRVLASEALRRDCESTVLSSPMELARALFHCMQAMLDIVVARAFNDGSNLSDEQQQQQQKKQHSLAATLLFATFSDARRRQSNAQQHQQHHMSMIPPGLMATGGGGGGGGATASGDSNAALAMAMAMMGGGAGGAAIGGMIPVPAEGSADAKAAMLAALQAQSQAQTQVLKEAAQHKQPEPPFPLPLSLLEELLILRAPAVTAEMHEVRRRVELAPLMPVVEKDGADAENGNEEDEEEKMMAMMNAAPPASYMGELLNEVVKVCSC